MRPDGNVYRSMRRRRIARGSFRRQRPGLFLALMLCVMAAAAAALLFGTWYVFFR